MQRAAFSPKEILYVAVSEMPSYFIEWNICCCCFFFNGRDNDFKSVCGGGGGEASWHAKKFFTSERAVKQNKIDTRIKGTTKKNASLPSRQAQNIKFWLGAAGWEGWQDRGGGGEGGNSGPTSLAPQQVLWNASFMIVTCFTSYSSVYLVHNRRLHCKLEK